MDKLEKMEMIDKILREFEDLKKEQKELEEKMLIKGDNLAKYPAFKNIKFALKKNNIFKFRIVTNSETVPPGSELYLKNREILEKK
jgi:biopolymer transport protein ExbD